MFWDSNPYPPMDNFHSLNDSMGNPEGLPFFFFFWANTTFTLIPYSNLLTKPNHWCSCRIWIITDYERIGLLRLRIERYAPPHSLLIQNNKNKAKHWIEDQNQIKKHSHLATLCFKKHVLPLQLLLKLMDQQEIAFINSLRRV